MIFSIFTFYLCCRARHRENCQFTPNTYIFPFLFAWKNKRLAEESKNENLAILECWLQFKNWIFPCVICRALQLLLSLRAASRFSRWCFWWFFSEAIPVKFMQCLLMIVWFVCLFVEFTNLNRKLIVLQVFWCFYDVFCLNNWKLWEHCMQGFEQGFKGDEKTRKGHVIEIQ